MFKLSAFSIPKVAFFPNNLTDYFGIFIIFAEQKNGKKYATIEHRSKGGSAK